MKLFEIIAPHVEVGAAYRLADTSSLGDYRNLSVYVEKGPRGEGKTEQYRVSHGQGNHDVDWIETEMFFGAVKLKDVPPELIYVKK